MKLKEDNGKNQCNIKLVFKNRIVNKLAKKTDQKTKYKLPRIKQKYHNRSFRHYYEIIEFNFLKCKFQNSTDTGIENLSSCKLTKGVDRKQASKQAS